MNRVKITYAVDLEEVPVKTQDLYNESLVWLDEVLSSLNDIELDNTNLNHLPLLEKIDKARRVLADVDQRLGDCVSIISGYHDVIHSPPPIAPPPELEAEGDAE